jgi:flagellar biosynthesis protein FliR
VTDLLTQLGPSQLVGFVLVLARITPLFIFAPLFSSRLIPLRVRGIVAIALAFGMAPLAMGGEQPPLAVWPLAELVVKEMLVGLAFAFAIGILFAALSVAGSILDTMIGFAFGAAVDPLTGNQGTVLAQLYGLLGVLIFIAIDGDAMVIRGFAHTYELVPLLELPALSLMLDGVLRAFTGIFASALQVAAPVLLALMLTDVAFGLVTKVVPQMNVFSIGLPTKVLVGLFITAAALPFVGGFVASELETSVRVALGSLGVS